MNPTIFLVGAGALLAFATMGRKPGVAVADAPRTVPIVNGDDDFGPEYYPPSIIPKKTPPPASPFTGPPEAPPPKFGYPGGDFLGYDGTASAKTTIPFPGGLQERINIEITQMITNSHRDYSLWVDCRVKLIGQHPAHWFVRLGQITAPEAGRNEYVWVMYQPADGQGEFGVIDFAQGKFPAGLAGTIVRTELGLRAYGPDAQEVDVPLYIQPAPNAEGFSKMVGVKSSMSQNRILVPPNSTIQYNPVLSIPGPNASPGLAEFWGQFDNLKFDIEFSIYQLAQTWDGNLKRDVGGREIGPREYIRDAVELDVEALLPVGGSAAQARAGTSFRAELALQEYLAAQLRAAYATDIQVE